MSEMNARLIRDIREVNAIPLCHQAHRANRRHSGTPAHNFTPLDGLRANGRINRKAGRVR